MYKIIIDNKTFFLSLLEVADIDEATALCDECVGKNLYPKEELEKIVDSTDKFFYLVKTLTGENIGYIYYSFTDIYSIAQYAKLDVNLLRAAYFSDSNIVGKIQSVGIKEEYRKNGLAEQLVQFTLKKLRELSIEIVFIVCWKIGQVVPLKKVMQKCNFNYLTEAKKVWYDNTDLVCPHCSGRCKCDAEVYYKLLN